MKKLNLLLTTIALIMFAQIINAQILNSAHDFKSKTWNTTGEICKVCHIPHNGAMLAEAPLWNHALSAVTNYSTYASSTLNATVGQPDGNSKLCLSCHDGSVALNNFGGNGVVTPNVYATGAALLGTDLSNDHPVSFTYNDALATTDGSLFPPSTALSGLGGTINADMLFAGKMQCASCHDVHNGATGTPAHLLIKSNAASALCLTCHDK